MQHLIEQEIVISEIEGQPSEKMKFTTIKISEEIEIITSPEEKKATLFFNDIDMEFSLHSISEKMINKMIEADFWEQIMIMQKLRKYCIS